MSTFVKVNTYTHSVTYVTDNVLRSLKDIVRLSGLSPERLTDDWSSVHLATSTWLESKDLLSVVLEIYDPSTDKLLVRWDISIQYGWDGNDGRFWTDTEQLALAIKKAGGVPATSNYRILLTTQNGRPDVPGWGPTTLRSTEGFIRQSLGTTVNHSGLEAGTSYYRKK